jgi:hypothetical protein
LEHPHRSALENHVHRTPRLGNHGLLNVRIGISRVVPLERGRPSYLVGVVPGEPALVVGFLPEADHEFDCVHRRLGFPLAAAAVAALPARSCLIDGEAIVTDRNGLAVFDLIRGHRPTAVVLCAFDLIEARTGSTYPRARLRSPSFDHR